MKIQAVIKKWDRKQLLQSYYKVWQKFITKSVRYYKVRQVLQSVTDIYYKVRQVLQSVTAVITKCVRYYKVWQTFITKFVRCYKVWQLLLQSASGITNCDSYYKVRRNTKKEARISTAVIQQISSDMEIHLILPLKIVLWNISMSVYTSIILTKFDQPLTVIFLTQFKAVEILKKSFLSSDSNSRCVCFITRWKWEVYDKKSSTGDRRSNYFLQDLHNQTIMYEIMFTWCTCFMSHWEAVKHLWCK